MEFTAKNLKIKKRPKSKIGVSRAGLVSAKAKFRVRVERNVDKATVVNCKNNEKLKLSTIACPNEKTDRIKRLERKLEYEKPLMDKGFQPGSQKSLFPSRKTEQEFMIFKEIFIEPKEKELEKLKERAKIEREQYEMKISMLKPKKKVLKPLSDRRFIGMDFSNSSQKPNLNTDSNFYNSTVNNNNKKRFEELISDFKKSIQGVKRKEDASGECLFHGKQGLDFFLSKNQAESLSSFQSCIQIGKSLK